MMPVDRHVMTEPLETKTLPLTRAHLVARAKGGLARVVLEQHFTNPHAIPLHVSYTLPLPVDAAVSGFSFVIGDRTIEGQVDRKADARQRFEEAIASGHTAALLEEETSSLFTQELGNIPPGASVVARITLDQRLAWLAEGAWEWRFPLAAAPRYLGAPGRVSADRARALDFVVAESSPVRASLEMTIEDAIAAGRSPESPSHPLQCAARGSAFVVAFGSGGAIPLDRDAVVRWEAAGPSIGVSADVCATREDTHVLLTLVPPVPSARAATIRRDLTLLLDTSGSMGGEPIAHAQRVAMALIGSLGPDDAFEVIEFSNHPRAYAPSALPASEPNKAAACAWVCGLRASGGTEMREGILAALAPSRVNAQKQVVLVTDGLIGFEQEIVAAILAGLPGGARVHTVGVGSSVNRTLTQEAARAGRGVEVICGLGEDVERVVARLLARTCAPIVTEVVVTGSALLDVAPARVPDLFQGAPVRLLAKVRPEGGSLRVGGKRDGEVFVEDVRIEAVAAGSGGAVRALFGREKVADLETRIAAGESKASLDRDIEAVGLTYQISTRMTSWVAIDRNPSVDPTKATRRETVPQALPNGVSAEGCGLRAPGLRQGFRGLAAATLGGAPGGMPAQAAAPMRPASPAARARVAADTGAPPPPRYVASASPPPGAPAREEKARLAPPTEAVTRAGTAYVPDIVGQGRIVRRSGRRLVLELSFFEATSFDPAAIVFFLLGGVPTTGTIDLHSTTGAGVYDRSLTVRIVVELATDPPESIGTITLMENARSLAISLTRG